MLSLTLSEGCDSRSVESLDLTNLFRHAVKCPTMRVMFRSGLEGSQSCFLWFYGLPDEVAAAVPESRSAPAAGPAAVNPGEVIISPMKQFPTVLEAVEATLVDVSSVGAQALRVAAGLLQQRVRPKLCTARWVDASYWSCDRSLCDLAKLSGASTSTSSDVGDRQARTKFVGPPLLALGDSCCGKPFVLSSTLMKHIWDVATLIDEVDWTHDGVPMSSFAFEPHERRYQTEICRVPEFHRKARRGDVLQLSPAPAVVPAPPPGPPPGPRPPSSPNAPPSPLSPFAGSAAAWRCQPAAIGTTCQ